MGKIGICKNFLRLRSDSWSEVRWGQRGSGTAAQNKLRTKFDFCGFLYLRNYFACHNSRALDQTWCSALFLSCTSHPSKPKHQYQHTNQQSAKITNEIRWCWLDLKTIEIRCARNIDYWCGAPRQKNFPPWCQICLLVLKIHTKFRKQPEACCCAKDAKKRSKKITAGKPCSAEQICMSEKRTRARCS